MGEESVLNYYEVLKEHMVKRHFSKLAEKEAKLLQVKVVADYQKWGREEFEETGIGKLVSGIEVPQSILKTLNQKIMLDSGNSFFDEQLQ